MLDFIPGATALQLGPLTIGWYGIGYAVGLAVAYLVMVRLARRAGEDPDILGNGMIVVALAALVGGRAYHVIDQWDALYKADPIRVFLPPYSGLGVYGGIITGTIAAYVYARYKRARSSAGPTSSRPASSSCRRSRDGGTSSTRSCTARRRRCRGASPSTAPTARRTSPVRGLPGGDDPASSRCSCTSRSPG